MAIIFKSAYLKYSALAIIISALINIFLFFIQQVVQLIWGSIEHFTELSQDSPCTDLSSYTLQRDYNISIGYFFTCLQTYNDGLFIHF